MWHITNRQFGVIDRDLVDPERVGVLQLRLRRIGVAGVEHDRHAILRGQFVVAAVVRVRRLEVQVAEVALQGDHASRPRGCASTRRKCSASVRVGSATPIARRPGTRAAIFERAVDAERVVGARVPGPHREACVTPAVCISRRLAAATVSGGSRRSGASDPVPGRFGGTAWMWTSIIGAPDRRRGSETVVDCRTPRHR